MGRVTLGHGLTGAPIGRFSALGAGLSQAGAAVDSSGDLLMAAVVPSFLVENVTAQFGWKHLVSNGAGSGLAAMSPNQALDGDHDLSLYSIDSTGVIGDAQFFVFAAFVPSFVDGSALSEMSSVARGFSDAGYPDALLELSFVIPSIQALLCVLLACLGVSRRAA